jgi:hypothetical protein
VAAESALGRRTRNTLHGTIPLATTSFKSIPLVADVGSALLQPLSNTSSPSLELHGDAGILAIDVWSP